MLNNNLPNEFLKTPNEFKNMVRTTLDSLPEKEEYVKMDIKKYKNKNFKKRVIAAVAATFVLGTTAFASGKLSSIVGDTSNIPTYKTIPSVEMVNKDFGFKPKLVDKFENGYKFESGYTENKQGYDDSENSIGKSKALSMTYQNKKAQISIDVEGMTLVGDNTKSVLADEYKSVDIYYTSYINKIVPSDYKMTQQDKKDEKEGKYVFSVGSEKVETSTDKYIGFKLNGLYYSILATDSELTKDDLVQMAHEIIDAK